MNELTGWTQVFFNSFQAFGQKIMGAIPEILGAILIFLLGWLLSRFIARLVTKALKVVKFDALAQRIGVQDFLSKANVQMDPSRLLGTFVYWLLMLLVIISASDALGWTAVSQEVSRLLGFLPNLMVAIIFFVIGTYIATFVRDVIRSASQSLGIAAGRMISSVAFYLLLILVILTSLNQAGVNTDIITNNLMIILSAILGAAALSYGLASREVMSNILANFFNRRTFTVGMIIEVNGTKGKIVATSSTSVTLETDGKELIVVPANELLTSRVTILKVTKS